MRAVTYIVCAKRHLSDIDSNRGCHPEIQTVAVPFKADLFSGEPQVGCRLAEEERDT